MSHSPFPNYNTTRKHKNVIETKTPFIQPWKKNFNSANTQLKIVSAKHHTLAEREDRGCRGVERNISPIITVGLRSLLTAKYCRAGLFHYYAETRLSPGGRARGQLLLIGRSVAARVRSRKCMRARVHTREQKKGMEKESKTSERGGRPRVCTLADAIDATTEHYREEWICVDGPAKECHRLTPGKIGLAVSMVDTEAPCVDFTAIYGRAADRSKGKLWIISTRHLRTF